VGSQPHSGAVLLSFLVGEVVDILELEFLRTFSSDKFLPVAEIFHDADIDRIKGHEMVDIYCLPLSMSFDPPDGLRVKFIVLWLESIPVRRKEDNVISVREIAGAICKRLNKAVKRWTYWPAAQSLAELSMRTSYFPLSFLKSRIILSSLFTVASSSLPEIAAQVIPCLRSALVSSSMRSGN
jgi:hypothetical protein